MQKFKVADDGNPDGTAKDLILGVQSGTKYKSAVWNDNLFNLFNAVENQGYTLIDDDLEQLSKAIKGKWKSTFTYNTSAIATQTVSDVVEGSDGYLYLAIDDAIIGDDPVGSISGRWQQLPDFRLRDQSITIALTVDADYTLSTYENLFGRIEINSSILTVTRNLIVDDTKHNNVTIINNEGFDLTVKTAAGTGVLVAAGAVQNIRNDGTNVEISDIGSGGGQFLGNASTKAIAYNAQTIAEDITVTAGLNAYTVGDVTIEDGFSVTVEDGALWKIL